MTSKTASEFYGLDLSHHQRNYKIDFKAMKASGYEFVMLRAGYGSYLNQKDLRFEQYYKEAKSAGLKVGAYIYSYAVSEDEAKREADCLLTWIKDKQLDYPVAFDIEDRRHKSLGRKKCTDVALAAMERIEASDYYTMLYSYADFIKNHLDMDRLKHFDIWLACYTSKERRDELYKHPILGMWQYSDGKKPKPIIENKITGTNLDHNVAYKDYAKIIRAAGLNNTIQNIG